MKIHLIGAELFHVFEIFGIHPKTRRMGNHFKSRLYVYNSEFYNLITLHIQESYATLVDVLSIEYKKKAEENCAIHDSDKEWKLV
jgi:hypothetical protein